MRLTTVFASALIAVASLSPHRAPGQVTGTPNLNPTPFTGVPVVQTPFTGVPGVPVAQTPFFQGVPANATIPRVVPELSNPRPLQTNVNPNLKQIRITFDQPMDTALFFWPLPTDNPAFPAVTQPPFWTNNNQTVVLPVTLSAGRIYEIPINSPTLVFRGATGLYANPGVFRFQTNNVGQGGSVSLGRTPAAVPNLSRTPIPAQPPWVRNPSGSTAAPAATGVTPAAGQSTGSNRHLAPVRQSTVRQSMSNPALQRATPTPTPRAGNTR